MLNLNCVICAELFGQSDDVHATVCGHMFHFTCLMQWIERSHTCPQCRNRLTQRNIFRVYFNVANLDSSIVDISSLQEQLDDLKLQVKLKDKTIKEGEIKIQSLKDSQKKCMKTITALEEKLLKNEFTIQSYAEQLKLLRADNKIIEDLRKENKRLHQQIDTMEGIAATLTSTAAEVEKLLQDETDRKRLCTWVVTLKRELRNTESKKTDLRNMLRVTQSNLRREAEVKKQLEERISQLESECYELKEKVTFSSREQPSGSRPTRYSMPDKSDSNYDKSLELLKKNLKSLDTSNVTDSVRKIEQSDSPYLNIKSSSVGLLPYGFKRNTEVAGSTAVQTTTKLATLKISPTKIGKNPGAVRKIPSDLTEKYSIFKKPRLALSAVASASTIGSNTNKVLPSNLVFNGFGGSDRKDPFASDCSDDEVEIVEEIKKKSPTTIQQKKPNSIIGTSLTERLKSGGLRNFQIQK